MRENAYYKTTIKVEYEDDKGRIKYRKEEYLVKAVNPTDVEKQIHKEMEGYDFEIISIVLTKIISVLGDD